MLDLELNPHAKIDNISVKSNLELTRHKIKLSFLLKGALEEYVFPESQHQKEPIKKTRSIMS